MASWDDASFQGGGRPEPLAGGRDGGRRDYNDRDSRDGGRGGGGGGEDRPVPSGRKRLQLKPRSKAAGSAGGYSSGKSSIFGGARPREDALKATARPLVNNW